MEQPIYGLSCAGGGAHGAYQVGALKYIHLHFSDGEKSPFQIFTGASCGSLNTSFYAAQSFDARQGSQRLEALWRGFHVPAYHGNLLKNIFFSLYKQWKHRKKMDSPWAGLLDPAPMKGAIEKGFKREHLLKAFEKKTTLGIAIAATELISGRTCWFQEGPLAKEWNLFHSIGLFDAIETFHLAASCSVPVLLPPVKINHRYYLDGTVSLTKPLSAAISMGADKILSIATDKQLPGALPEPRPGFRPKISSVIRMLLNQLSHDAAGDEANEIQTLNQFYQGLSSRSRKTDKEELTRPLFDENSRPAHYHEVEIFRLVPSKRIRSISGIEESSLTGHKRTRFAFHESFIRELIELGYQDAKARHEDLKNFLLPKAYAKKWFFKS